MVKIELSDSEVEYLRTNYGRITVREIAAHLYVSTFTVYNLVKRYGIERVPRPKAIERPKRVYNRWTQNDREIFLAMTDAHYTYHEIAAVLHRSVGSVVQFKHNYYPDYPSPCHQSKAHDNGGAT